MDDPTRICRELRQIDQAAAPDSFDKHSIYIMESFQISCAFTDFRSACACVHKCMREFSVRLVKERKFYYTWYLQRPAWVSAVILAEAGKLIVRNVY